MMRGLIVVITAALARIFLRRKQYRHHILSIMLILGGITIVGMSSLYSKDSSNNSMIGLILIVSSQLVAGVQMILEEKILSMGNVHPLRMVGWEGFWGLLFVTTMLTIF